MNPFTDKRTRIYTENRYNFYERTIQNTQLMYIFNGPIGYDELTGTIYINPESVDGFVVAQSSGSDRSSIISNLRLKRWAIAVDCTALGGDMENGDIVLLVPLDAVEPA